jgi:hypothetical protein
MGFTPTDLENALEALGALLASRGHTAEIAVIGGGSLLLMGLIQRATKDLDVVAVVEQGAMRRGEPLPAPVVEAVEDVARAMGLAKDWLNPGPSDLFTYGLPAGFRDRVHTRTYSSLIVHFADRIDQIHFKLYAVVDQGPKSKHFADLLRLSPTEQELAAAAAWCITHDPSDGFAMMLAQALAELEKSLDR